MIDSTGKVRYAAVSYGGFMGMGDKMYAVPMYAFTFKRVKDMFFDDVKLMLFLADLDYGNDSWNDRWLCCSLIWE